MTLLSQGRPTKQSSVGWGGVPQRAVDGNVNGRYGRRTTTHTKYNKNNWWLVDLQRKTKVYTVLIHNRVDCCQNRINGAQVEDESFAFFQGEVLILGLMFNSMTP
jgi:hypothetical protein